MAELKQKQTTAVVIEAEDANESADMLLTITQLEERLQISRSTIFQWRLRGIIPSIKSPGTNLVRFHWGSVKEALLRRQRATERVAA
jgi:predicted DNA-binding transcriptional regulator AlpA